MRYLLLAVLLLFSSPALAEGEYAAGSEAKSWGLLGEEKALFTAEVVDILCTLTGDCPANCGDGRRQLGLLREADGKLVLVSKNAQGVFSGAVEDLLPYCGRKVEVDGLLVGDAEWTPTKVFQVQRLREPGGQWSKANRWTRSWNKANPEIAKVKGSWFRKDPRVLREIEKDGYLGLGLAADEKFKAYYFEE